MIIRTLLLWLGETLSSLLHASRQRTVSPSIPISSLSLLVQRAIVRSVVLERSISRGRFSESYIGKWRRERVTVKIYPHIHERMWYSETLLHQVKGYQCCRDLHAFECTIVSSTCRYLYIRTCTTYLLFNADSTHEPCPHLNIHRSRLSPAVFECSQAISHHRVSREGIPLRVSLQSDFGRERSGRAGPVSG